MIPAYTYAEICRDLTSERWSDVKLAGILFARPTSPLAKEEVIPNLQYFHHRSNGKAHFFCGGFSEHAHKDAVLITQIDDSDWHFSNERFNKLRTEIEDETNWRYSGATDLILLNTVISESETELNFASAFLFPLDKMKADGVIYSAEMFFEDIFRFADNYNGNNAVTEFLNPPDIGDIRVAPINIGVLWQRAKDCWQRQDYGGVLHACASVFEAMAKHIVQAPSVQNKPLGSFFDKYRNHSALSEEYLDEILKIYNQRSITPISGHGSVQAPNIAIQDARKFMDFTSNCVRLEYKSLALNVGKT